jgi:hypothetical protein
MQEEEGDTTINVAKSGRYLISTRFVTNASSKSVHASMDQFWNHSGNFFAIGVIEIGTCYGMC